MTFETSAASSATEIRHMKESAPSGKQEALAEAARLRTEIALNPNQKDNTIMKTRTEFIRSIKHVGVSLVLAALVSLPSTVIAAEQMKGAQRLMKQVTTQAEAEALKPGDEMAMVCAKCKSVVVHYVNTEKGHIKTMTVGEKHLCPGCDGIIEVVGTGKAKHDVVKHVCSKCGDDSAFCCATKPGAGATEGLEKK